MGILDSFKKALGGRGEAEANEINRTPGKPAPAVADEKQAEPEPTLAVEHGAEQGSYTVQSGDTLWSIAENAYGDGSKYSKIFDANHELLEQPDRIFPGQKLLIPDLED